MRGAFVIAGKDLRNIFFSPLFYIIAGVCSLIWWVLFVVRVGEFIRQSAMKMMQGQGSAQGLPLHFFVIWGHFSVVNLILLFTVGAITMRLFTEEYRNRTYELLLTSPVTATDIAIGKLIAGVGTVWALVLVSCLYPLSLAFFGSLEWGPLASSLIGLLLLSATYVAVGMFASSLTQSAVVAVILALVFNIMLWFFGALSETANSPMVKAIWEHFNVGTHFQIFMKGAVSISGLVFFLSLIFLFTFLTQRVVESSRWR